MSNYREIAQSIARYAGLIIKEGYKNKKNIQYKDVNDLVTDTDLQSESYILSSLQENFPNHGVLTEERGKIDGDSDYLWVVDPLDGTTNFAHGVPIFSVSICLQKANKPILGVVYDPILDELYSAELGKGATLNGKPIKVSDLSDLSRALIATGFPSDIRTNPHNNLDQFLRFQYRVQSVRRAGSAALDCAWVARGGFDGYWEFGIKPWDVSAGAFLVQESRGKVTTIEGREYNLAHDNIVVSNGSIHDQMLSVLHEGIDASHK